MQTDNDKRKIVDLYFAKGEPNRLLAKDLDEHFFRGEIKKEILHNIDVLEPNLKTTFPFIYNEIYYKLVNLTIKTNDLPQQLNYIQNKILRRIKGLTIVVDEDGDYDIPNWVLKLKNLHTLNIFDDFMFTGYGLKPSKIHKNLYQMDFLQDLFISIDESDINLKAEYVDLLRQLRL